MTSAPPPGYPEELPSYDSLYGFPLSPSSPTSLPSSSSSSSPPSSSSSSSLPLLPPFHPNSSAPPLVDQPETHLSNPGLTGGGRTSWDLTELRHQVPEYSDQGSNGVPNRGTNGNGQTRNDCNHGVDGLGNDYNQMRNDCNQMRMRIDSDHPALMAVIILLCEKSTHSLPLSSLSTLSASFKIPFEPLTMLISATHPPSRRPELLRLLSSSLEPMTLPEVLAILDMTPFGAEATPSPRLQVLRTLLPSIVAPLSEQDLHSLILAIPAASRTDALHLILFILPAAADLRLSSGTLYHILKALTPESRLVGVDIMRLRLQSFNFTFEQFLLFVKFIAAPQRVPVIQALSAHLPHLSGFEDVMQVVGQILELPKKTAAFISLAPRLPSSLPWAEVSPLLKEFPVSDRVQVISTLSSVLSSKPTFEEIALLLTSFPESSSGVELRAKTLVVLAKNLKGLMNPQDFAGYLMLLPAKGRSTVVPAFMPNLKKMSGEELAILLTIFPENYGHRQDALDLLKSRLISLTLEGMMGILALFESKGCQMSSLGMLLPFVGNLDKEALLQLFPNDRRKVTEILRKAGLS